MMKYGGSLQLSHLLTHHPSKMDNVLFVKGERCNLGPFPPVEISIIYIWLWSQATLANWIERLAKRPYQEKKRYLAQNHIILHFDCDFHITVDPIHKKSVDYHDQC